MRQRLISNLPAIATGVALATALALITPRAAGDQRDEIDALAIVLCVITGLAIGFRREYPLGQYVVAMAAVLTYAARDYPGGPIYLVAFGSALAMVAGTERRTWMPAAFIGGALLIAVPTAVSGWETHFLIFGAIWFVGSVLFGEAARLRREQARTTEARAEFTQRSREQEARRRLAEERLQIARDVHDVVGHSLATIALQAGVAEHLLDGREEKARESMAAIRRLSREALGEVSAMLGVLRSDNGAERAPAPDLDQVSRLVEDVRAAGLSVELELDGRHVPEVVGGAAYRIVQESLTNVVRHAGPDASRARTRNQRPGRPRGRDHRRRRRRRARRAGRQRADRHARARHGARRQLRGRRRARRRLPRPRDAPGAMTRVVLVDDQALVRGGLRALLEAEDDLEVVGEAADGAAGGRHGGPHPARRRADGHPHARRRRPRGDAQDRRRPRAERRQGAHADHLRGRRVRVRGAARRRFRLPAQGRGAGRAAARRARGGGGRVAALAQRHQTRRGDVRRRPTRRRPRRSKA